MKKMVMVLVLAMTLISLSGCGGYLVNRNKDMWANSWDRTNVDLEKFNKDHEECCQYTKNMINIPFMDYVHTSSGWYSKCMKGKGYRERLPSKGGENML